MASLNSILERFVNQKTCTTAGERIIYAFEVDENKNYLPALLPSSTTLMSICADNASFGTYMSNTSDHTADDFCLVLGILNGGTDGYCLACKPGKI